MCHFSFGHTLWSQNLEGRRRAVDIAMERMIAEMVKKLAVQRVFSRPQIVSWEMVQEGLCQRWKSNVLIVDCPWGDALDINAVDIKIDRE